MTSEHEGPVDIPAEVLEGLRRWHREGRQNTSGSGGVLRWLRDDGWYAAADWVEQNPQRYQEVINQPGILDSPEQEPGRHNEAT